MFLAVSMKRRWEWTCEKWVNKGIKPGRAYTGPANLPVDIHGQ